MCSTITICRGFLSGGCLLLSNGLIAQLLLTHAFVLLAVNTHTKIRPYECEIQWYIGANATSSGFGQHLNSDPMSPTTIRPHTHRATKDAPNYGPLSASSA